MTQVIVHAGFHKTGTTSLQAFLETNRKALKPWADVYLKTDLGAARYLGRLYGQRPWLLRRLLFRRGFRRFLATVPEAETILISRESFSGMMPGNRRWGRTRLTRYEGQAIPLAREMVAAIQRRFGPETEIMLLFTIREFDSWVYSLYRHILRTSALRDDFDSFRSALAQTPPLADQARAIARAAAPARLQLVSLEQTRDLRLGHGAAILKLLGVPRAQWPRFRPGGHHLRGTSEALTARFLEMNRTSRRGPELKEQKRLLAERERKQWK